MRRLVRAINVAIVVYTAAVLPLAILAGNTLAAAAMAVGVIGFGLLAIFRD